jgi:hypothetical protein
MNWKPLQIIPQPSISIAATLRPAGLGNAIGVIGAEIYKDPADPKWNTDPEMAAYRDFMHLYRPSADMSDRMNLLGYVNASAVVQILQLCGDDITPKAIMHQASHLDRMRIPLMLPGISLSTTPTVYAAIRRMQLQRFDGKQWQPMSDVVADEEPNQ